MSNEKMYVVNDPVEGCFVGSLLEVIDWIREKDVHLQLCKVWELGEECKLTIKVEKVK